MNDQIIPMHHRSSRPIRPRVLRILALSLLLLAIQPRKPLVAQTQFAGWLATFQNYKLNKHLGVYFDGQLRSTGQWKDVQQIILRPGLNVYLTPALTATVGYAYIPNRRTLSGVSDLLAEHRSWEQLLLTHPLRSTHRTGGVAHGATLTHRLRLEQRYLPKPKVEGDGLTTNGHSYASRLRYFTRALLPLPAAPFTEGFYAALQNEVFVNIGDPSAVNGKFFDQNRAYIAFGYRFTKQFDTEIGYVNQYISGAGDNSTNNHILQCATYIRL